MSFPITRWWYSNVFFCSTGDIDYKEQDHVMNMIHWISRTSSWGRTSPACGVLASAACAPQWRPSTGCSSHETPPPFLQSWLKWKRYPLLLQMDHISLGSCEMWATLWTEAEATHLCWWGHNSQRCILGLHLDSPAWSDDRKLPKVQYLVGNSRLAGVTCFRKWDVYLDYPMRGDSSVTSMFDWPNRLSISIILYLYGADSFVSGHNYLSDPGENAIIPQSPEFPSPGARSAWSWLFDNSASNLGHPTGNKLKWSLGLSVSSFP